MLVCLSLLSWFTVCLLVCLFVFKFVCLFVVAFLFASFPALSQDASAKNLVSGQKARGRLNTRKPRHFSRKIAKIFKSATFLQPKKITIIHKIMFDNERNLLCQLKAFLRRICKLFLLEKCLLGLPLDEGQFFCFLLCRHKVARRVWHVDSLLFLTPWIHYIVWLSIKKVEINLFSINLEQ